MRCEILDGNGHVLRLVVSRLVSTSHLIDKLSAHQATGKLQHLAQCAKQLGLGLRWQGEAGGKSPQQPIFSQGIARFSTIRHLLRSSTVCRMEGNSLQYASVQSHTCDPRCLASDCF
jgi:hypothetical protein